MNVYSSKEAVEFAKKALDSGDIAHIVNGYFRPLKDNIILPCGDVYDIGSRFQIIGVIEEAAPEVKEEAAPEVKEEVVEEAPVAKTTRSRKAAK